MGKTKIECKKLEVLSGDQKCVFCHQTTIDEMKYGPVYMHKNIITHYYCLLLSSNMEQNGRDSDGILGFLPNDIHKEVKRGVRLNCTYCRSGGATLGCAVAKCKVMFHLPCGLRHGTLHQFFGQFKSFCAKHRPVQRISPKILAEASKNAMCGICYEKVVPRPIHETLWAPCCQKSAFFHRDCVQQLALSAGYFFKCPLCNNTKTFQDEMKEYGIYIPEQDASWECVPNAYQDLLVRHDTCDSATCGCPSGRKTNNQGTRWELILCKFCGSQGIHIGCGRLKWKSPEFVCNTCSGNNLEQEANRRDYEGNRHRLSGTGRTPQIRATTPVDREEERSDDDESSDESTQAKLTNRSGRRRIVSPPPRIDTPPPDTRTHRKTERRRKRSASSTTHGDLPEDTRKESDTVVIDDSDDDVEVVEETKGGSCLKTNDGAMIPIIQVKDNVKKRLNVEGDVNIVPDEIVDITDLKEGPPRKRNPSPHVEEIIYGFPSLPPKPSPSTSYCPPAAAPLDVTKFVLVDPATFRPEELPPGTLLYRSYAPMVPVPQPSASTQPAPAAPVTPVPVQPMPDPKPGTSSHPVSQLGGPRGRSADAEHPDLSEHGGGDGKHLNPSARRAAQTSRSNERDRSGRRRRRGRDHDRLNPRVLLSPLKCRISKDGFFEIFVPRRNLGFGFYSGSLKRKASPLPSRPAKKIKVSQKDLVVEKKKKSSKKSNSGNQRKSSNENKNYNGHKKKTAKSKTVKKTLKSKTTTKTESKKCNVPQEEKIVLKDTEGKGKRKYNRKINNSLSSNKDNQAKKKKRSISESSKGKENSPPKKKSKGKRGLVLTQWKKIDEYYLSKQKIQSNDPENTTLSGEREESSMTIKEIIDNIIDFVVEEQSSKDLSSPTCDDTNKSFTSNESGIYTDTSSNSIVSETKTQKSNTSIMREFPALEVSTDLSNEKEDNIANRPRRLTPEFVINTESPNCPVLEVSNNISHQETTGDTRNPMSLTHNIKTTSEPLSYEIEISDNDCEASKEQYNLPVSHDTEVEEMLMERRSVELPSLAQDLNQCKNDGISHKLKVPSDSEKGSPDANLGNSFLIQKKVNLEENELKICSSYCEEKSAIQTCGLFPKIKMKIAPKTKRKKELPIPAPKQKKIPNVNLENSESMKNSKTMRSIKDLSKTKKKKMKKGSPVGMFGSIEKYFSTVKKDNSFSPTKTFRHLTHQSTLSEDIREDKNDYYQLSLEQLEKSRFWGALSTKNSPGKMRKNNLFSDFKHGNSISHQNQNLSPVKRPLAEINDIEEITKIVSKICFNNH